MKLVEKIRNIHEHLKVLEDFLAAADRSRPGASIGEVRFDIRSQHASQTPHQTTEEADARPQHPKKNPCEWVDQVFCWFL